MELSFVRSRDTIINVCPPSRALFDLYAYWNFNYLSDDLVYDLSYNGHNAEIYGALSEDINNSNCETQSLNYCNSVTIVNLNITSPDTSIDYITACDFYEINNTFYTESGTYEYIEEELHTSLV